MLKVNGTAANAKETMAMRASPAGMVRSVYWLAPALLFLGSVGLTKPPFAGDGPSYTAEIADIVAHKAPVTDLWEPGHILWRPLGYAAAPLLLRIVPERWAWTPALKIYCGLALFNICCGAAACILLVDISRRLSASWVAAGAAALLFVWGDAVLAYSSSATPYIAGLAALVAGLWSQIGSNRHSTRFSIVPPVFFAVAALFWLPYLVAIPAACCAELFLGGESRGTAPWKRAAATLALCGMLVFAGIAAAGTLAGAHSLAEWRNWLTGAGHGIRQNRQAIRAISGVSRLFLDLGKDYVYFKRFLFHDPYHPVSLTGLFRHNLWKIALFYVMVASTVVLAWRSHPGRRALTLLMTAAAPALLAALVIFEPSSPERYLPVLPFLILCIAASWKDGWSDARSRFAMLGILLFALLLPILNLPAFAWGTGDFHNEAASQLTKLRLYAKRDAAVFTITLAEPLQQLVLHPFDDANRGGDVRAMFVIDPMSADLAHWQNRFARAVESEWAHGRAVWIERYALDDQPADTLLWTEGDNPAVHWRDIREFFRTVEFDGDTGGGDGFLRVSRSPQNEMLLRDLSATGRWTENRGALPDQATR
jgi:hypothetical protein